ncbi:PemK-like protein; toxin of a toxin-antitoxin system (plasmid) [Legionella adelaidensis]|uniref:mRNA interferase n=1 Tax=Legionella adelaidensis TaxID=45056 RepID=A0A0W0R3R8_9GAMM|nr:type II toxin-antitoxin system PemK/MazF family toxin [Legionella adelaidensis]KTC65720.1 mRNA interferase MazF9 [Legionella adelaidensis]VEH85114.1 PemK-like protein; toxin of a toxin-antitoxin system [Legionella adelaidensis]
MNRGDIYWIDLNPTTGSEINKQRPCVLVGATPINQARHTVIVVPLSTSAKARPPITISVSCLNKNVTAICDQIRTVDKSRLKGFIGPLSDKDLNALDEGLRQVLSL